MAKDKTLQRMTSQRRVIMEELKHSDNHPTADELYRLVRDRMPNVSLGTVYRNLDIMVNAGMVNRIETGNGRSRYDARMDKHYHIRCVGCGRIDDVEGEIETSIDTERLEIPDFEVVGHRLELLGLCRVCRNKEEGNGNGESEKQQGRI